MVASRSASSSTSVPRTFGSSTAGRALRSLQHQRAVVEHARGMKDAVDLPKLLGEPGNDVAHLVEIGHVRLGDEQSRRDGTDLNAAFESSAFRLPSAGRRSARLPTVLREAARSGLRAPAGIEFARQMFGDDQPNAAQPAGDEVDASALQAGALGRGGEVEPLERFDESLAAAIRNGGVLADGRHLGRRSGPRIRRPGRLRDPHRWRGRQIREAPWE